MMKKRLAVLTFFWVFLWISSAFAAQNAVVDADNLPLLDGPQKGANVIRRLKKGMHLQVSNYPTEGYYKARTPEKQIGWVGADSLDLKKTAPEQTDSSAE
ncbi:MAG: SH3 domain-containing protein [Oligoflexia bacterium]|nr:SH3 domain-containing protein [Oligoflexia bacterium]